MTGPFVSAVTEAEHLGVSWQTCYYQNDGEWPPERRETYAQANRHEFSPGWREGLVCTMQMEGLLSRTGL